MREEDGRQHWYVRYDDDGGEDLEEKQMEVAVKLYQQNPEHQQVLVHTRDRLQPIWKWKLA